MTRLKLLTIPYLVCVIILSLSMLSGCEDAMDKNPKYQTPEWLEGKMHDVVKSIPELSTFSQCLEKTGIGNIINSSGLYTLMAPSNEAFETYFSNHPEYNSIDDIDSITLKNLVEFHIILMPYSKKQLRTLDLGGWIDDSDDDPQNLCYKRITFNQPENLVLKVVENNGVVTAINSNGNAERKVFSEYNKYAPIFYSEHLNYAHISSSDYEYYFDRNFEQPEIYFGGAKLISILNEDNTISGSFSAENGYVYILDKVEETMQNGYEHLFNDDSDRPKYSQFGNLINEFADITYNEQATYDQPGASEGLEVDVLFDLNYPSLAYNIFSENTYGNISELSLTIHNGLLAPTNEAYNTFVSQVLTNNSSEYYMNMSQVPANIKRLVVNSHMIQWSPYYPSYAGADGNISNSNGTTVDISGINPVERVFGSNVTFVGLDEVVIPRLLSSVVAPVILRRDYSSFFWALYASNATGILQVPSSDYTLFAIPDEAFEYDSTLYVDGISNSYSSNPSVGRFRIWDKSNETYLSIPRRSVVDNFSIEGFVYGHIGIGTIQGNCRKEFIRNLSGRYIVIDNENNTVSGGEYSTAGFNGGDNVILSLDEKLEEDYGSYGSAPNNGSTYSIDAWLNFPSSTFSTISITNLGGDLFLSLLKRVGMVDELDKFTILDEGEVLTVLLPSESALISAQVDTLSDAKLKELLQAHFILGVNAFTDNINKNPLATKYYTKNGKRITLMSTAPDELDILTNTGGNYYTITENGSTNKMYLGWNNGNETDGSTYSNKILAGIATVMHNIDVVLNPDEVLE